MEYGAIITLTVIDTHPRRSPLIQGGLEIPVKAEVKMACTEKNKLAMHKYKSLTDHLYKEPVDGIFEDATDLILQELNQDDESASDMEEEYSGDESN